MHLMFVYYAFEDQGSGNVIQGYTQAGRALGHEVTVFGPPNPKVPLNYSLDIGSADALVFIFEWTTQFQYGDQLDFTRLVARVPRSRRVILDGDGNYNDAIRVDDDYNHRDGESQRRWISFCDSLSDKICQPTLHPLRDNVRSFPFYAYDPAWEMPLDCASKQYGMVYVGHCKFRWCPMHRVLKAIEPVRAQVGRIAMVGEGWRRLPWWAVPMGLEDAYCSDPAYLESLGVEVLPPVPFGDVIGWMSKASFNPVIVRPTFGRMQFVTPRIFETPAANTVPLLALNEEHAREIYGPAALELTLSNNDPHGRILDLGRRPEHYADAVMSLRRHLAEHHSYTARLRQLIGIIEN